MTMTYLPAIPPACHRCAWRGRAETAAPAQKGAGRRRRAGGADGRESCGRPGKASAATDPGCGCTGCSAASAETRTEQGLSPCVGNQIGTLFVRIKTQQAHFRGNPLVWQGTPTPPFPAETQTEQGLSPCIARFILSAGPATTQTEQGLPPCIARYPLCWTSCNTDWTRFVTLHSKVPSLLDQLQHKLNKVCHLA